jgi:hypothetical protein
MNVDLITVRLLLTQADLRLINRAAESSGAALLSLRVRLTGRRAGIVTSARLNKRRLPSL